MVIKRFEDIVAWQKAKILTIILYQHFEKSHDFSFRDQIQRAAVSVMNNIAEGFERRGDKKFKNFLFIAKGSCGEVRSMLYLALELKYMDPQTYKTCYEITSEVSKMLTGLIKSLH